ncbi:hypothetical protein OF83DRAFT_1164173 [Amylostereum chailletii]|nr:hypothetical protein OF83DRAFT_1164173 [Amylostereum chailletii]
MHVLSVLSLALVVPATYAASCTATQPNHLCCTSLAPFSANSYVWTNICGITGVDPSTPTASFCDDTATCSTDLVSVCCETLATCQSGVDGPIGLNCAQVEN